MNIDHSFLRWMRTLAALATLSITSVLSQAADSQERVQVVRIPGASNLMKAQVGADGAIHVVYDAAGGPWYVKSTDGGKTFSAPLVLVDPASRKPGLEFITWDLVVAADGGVHVALGNNAWKLKLPDEEKGYFYATLAPGAKAFAPLRNLNRKPSEGFSLAAGKGGAVTANFLAGKIYTMASRDGGETFSTFAELNPSLDPCKCCTTSTTFGPDGRLAMLYREETNNERDIYLVLADPNGGKQARTRISTTPWKLEGCPMTYFTIQGTDTGYVAAWPTKGQIYFARLGKDGAVLPPGEIKTPGRNGMRTGIVALSAKDGATLVAWKNQEALGWQLYNAQGQPIGNAGSEPSRGSGAAAVALPDGRFMVFP
ncbi:MAG TPA: hypothetical protein VK961_04675 [Chthoniobacter sp.]|nr:hypothetical protein [Chthoniobacter sp.]